jgi:hypothetical protein
MRKAILSIILFFSLCFISLFFMPVMAAEDYGISIKDTIIPENVIFNPNDTLPWQDELQRDTLPTGDTLPVATAQPQADEKEDETLSLKIPWYTQEQLENPFQLEPNFVDTTLLNFHHYDYAARDGLFYASKGNPGHTYRPLKFDPKLSPGLDHGHETIYGRYIFHHDQLRFYRPKYTFTDLSLVTGDNREQLFYAKHAQRLHETFYVGFQYRVINSPGAFTRLSARNVNLYLTADYLHPSKRYQALGSFIINRVRNQESGGLINPDAFEENELRDSVYLYSAESWYRDVSINLRHFYQTGFYAGRDSLNEGRFINLGRIDHGFTYSRNSYVFIDESSPYPFYDYEPHYPQSTFDSTVIHKIWNEVSWSNFPLESGRGNFPFNFKIFLQHSINTIQQPWFPDNQPLFDSLDQPVYYYDKENYNELIQGIELQSDQSRFLSFGGFANVTVGGYNDEDFHAGAYISLGRPDRNYNLEGLLRVANMEAPYFYNNFRSNFISWENNFDKMQVLNLRGKLKTPWLQLEGNYYLLNNMVYMNRDALPVQNSSGFSFISLGAYSDIELGRFGFRNHGIYQYSTTSQFEDYPAFISYHSVYVNASFFDGALINRLGFDFHFNTGYRAMSWMPVTRSFYAQKEHMARDKFLLDVFWSGKIKRTRLFVKFQNILAPFIDLDPHYDVLFYPIPETAFKFGVSWMFFN